MCAVTRNVTNVTLNWKLQPGSPALLLPPNSLVISASTSLTSWDSHNWSKQYRLSGLVTWYCGGIGGGVFSYTWRKDCEWAKYWQKIVQKCWYLDKIVNKMPKIMVSEVPKTAWRLCLWRIKQNCWWTDRTEFLTWKLAKVAVTDRRAQVTILIITPVSS